LIIQTLTTTVYTAGITPETTLVFKAVVVIAVCLMQAPKFRQLLRRRRRNAAPEQHTVPEPGAAALDKVAAS
jgi:simple sugar transport system permease protein